MTVAAITGEITCVCLVVLLPVGGWLLFLSEKSAAVLYNPKMMPMLESSICLKNRGGRVIAAL